MKRGECVRGIEFLLVFYFNRLKLKLPRMVSGCIVDSIGLENETKVSAMSQPYLSNFHFFCQNSFKLGIPTKANDLQLPKLCAHFTPPSMGICYPPCLECSHLLPKHAFKLPASPTTLLQAIAPVLLLPSSFINHPLPSPCRANHPSLYATGRGTL